MGLSCGLVGLSGCGKTTIFNAITSAGATSFDGSEMNRAVVGVPDSRVPRLIDIYKPKKVVYATLQVIDIPGLSTGSTANQGRGNKLLGHIKDVDALLYVVRCFNTERNDPKRDIETIDIELMVADAQTLENKIARLEKKAKGCKETAQEVADCLEVKVALEEGIVARKQNLSQRHIVSVFECNLLSLKPVLYLANIASVVDLDSPQVRSVRSIAEAEASEMIAVCGRDEAEISQLEPEERPEFLRELGLLESSMERLIRAAYRKLGLLSFFTAGEKEVHVWTCRQGDRAPVAAGRIHSDMESGFIRMEVIGYQDLITYGSEAAVARAGKQRIEGKSYEVQDGDIVFIRFSPPK
ncbi:MAG: redox-regulated ATPase YchF [Deltaproteobacteria bacterium]|nr:redox-regulated ATPase YchF [Deltaproteobacteria bacterium]